jgi:23S rRNA (pseudouridine1915-N3)-methyltransferase
MKIKIIGIGKIKEGYFTSAIAEYVKRLQPYTDIEIIELPEARLKDKASQAQVAQALAKEAQDIQKRIKSEDYAIALDLDGAQLSSEALATHIDGLMSSGHSSLAFIIGSSQGLAESLKSQVDERLKLSDMTFPHQLVRVILLEQIYRAFKINRGEPYHK